MTEVSGLYKAGTILLLVGGIVQVVGALTTVLLGIFFLTLGGLSDVEPFPITFMGPLYMGIGLVVAVGAVFAFIGWNKARANDPQGAWIMGLVGSLVPPLQLVTLLGAIFCRVSPEGEAARRA